MSTYLAVGIGTGIFFALIYVVEATRRKIRPNLEDAVLIVIGAVGLAVAGKVVYICISSSNLGPFQGEDAVYICLGGFALAWVSANQLRNGIFGPKREHDAKKKAEDGGAEKDSSK
jgi:hypothetical protein